MRHVAIIGAGVAGLACAARLRAAGLDVTLFDQAASPGGRCATQATPAGPFDAGAASFSAVSAPFGAQMQAWASEGALAPDPLVPGAWLGAPNMSAWVQHLARGLLIAGGEVAAIERAEQGRWALRLHAGLAPGQHFDAVVVAVPAEQGVALLQPDPALAAQLRNARSEACWSVLAGWPTALALSDELFPAAPAPCNGPAHTPPVGPLACARREEAKPGRPPVSGFGTRWVLHASPYWSANNLDVPPDQVVRHLLDAFARAAGRRLARPSFAQARLRRYATVVQPLQQACGWNAELRLGACGDAWHGLPGAAGVERAWLSGRALADRLLA